jgi:hypothetical protein
MQRSPLQPVTDLSRRDFLSQVGKVRAPRHRYHAFVAEQIKKAGIILPLKHFWAKAQQKGYRLWISHTRKYIQ